MYNSLLISMDNVPIDEMKIKHIEEICTVRVELVLDGKILFTKQQVKDTFGGPIKTRANLIETNNDETTSRIVITGYVTAQNHHSSSAIEQYVENAIQRSLDNIDSHLEKPSLRETSVEIKERLDVEENQGSAVLNSLK